MRDTLAATTEVMVPMWVDTIAQIQTCTNMTTTHIPEAAIITHHITRDTARIPILGTRLLTTRKATTTPVKATTTHMVEVAEVIVMTFLTPQATTLIRGTGNTSHNSVPDA